MLACGIGRGNPRGSWDTHQWITVCPDKLWALGGDKKGLGGDWESGQGGGGAVGARAALPGPCGWGRGLISLQREGVRAG